MLIGNWGVYILFQVNSDRVLTFRNWEQSLSARWEQHGILGDTPRAEFLGPDVSTITMEVVLNAELGVPPLVVKENLEKHLRNGDVHYLYLDAKKVGKNKWYLESMSAAYDTVMNDGKVLQAKLQLTFSEYVEVVR